jgi:hypothetical protein
MAGGRERGVERWETWVPILNDLAGMTLVTVRVCDQCGRPFPASPRLRVARCLPCRDRVRRERRKAANRPHLHSM